MERIKRSLKAFGIAFLLFIPIGLVANEFKSARLNRGLLKNQEYRAQREMEKAAILREEEKATKVKEESVVDPVNGDD